MVTAEGRSAGGPDSRGHGRHRRHRTPERLGCAGVPHESSRLLDPGRVGGPLSDPQHSAGRLQSLRRVLHSASAADLGRRSARQPGAVGRLRRRSRRRGRAREAMWRRRAGGRRRARVRGHPADGDPAGHRDRKRPRARVVVADRPARRRGQPEDGNGDVGAEARRGRGAGRPHQRYGICALRRAAGRMGDPAPRPLRAPAPGAGLHGGGRRAGPWTERAPLCAQRQRLRRAAGRPRPHRVTPERRSFGARAGLQRHPECERAPGDTDPRTERGRPPRHRGTAFDDRPEHERPPHDVPRGAPFDDLRASRGLGGRPAPFRGDRARPDGGGHATPAPGARRECVRGHRRHRVRFDVMAAQVAAVGRALSGVAVPPAGRPVRHGRGPDAEPPRPPRALGALRSGMRAIRRRQRGSPAGHLARAVLAKYPSPLSFRAVPAGRAGRAGRGWRRGRKPPETQPTWHRRAVAAVGRAGELSWRGRRPPALGLSRRGADSGHRKLGLPPLGARPGDGIQSADPSDPGQQRDGGSPAAVAGHRVRRRHSRLADELPRPQARQSRRAPGVWDGSRHYPPHASLSASCLIRTGRDRSSSRSWRWAGRRGRPRSIAGSTRSKAGRPRANS